MRPPELDQPITTLDDDAWVAFEADDHDVEQGWSVVVKGYAHVLSGSDEIAEAERAQVLPWTATSKQRFIRIRPVEITGGRFQFGAEPHYGIDLGRRS
jgi:hypothetical protein